MIYTQRKRALRTVGRILPWVLLPLIILALAGAAFLTFNGLLTYREAVREKPLSVRIDEVRAREDYVTLGQMPSLYPQAVVAVEDHRFYVHCGIDLISVCRAVLTNLRAHAAVEGGSTITQQLAKNLLFSQEKTVVRKAAEVFAAFDLEQMYSKTELLELYINTIYYGSDYTGLTAAARGYFGCRPSRLSDVQCTLLVGLPQAPSAYTPENDPDLTLQRHRQVLDSLVSEGVLTQDRADTLAQQAAGTLRRWMK